MSTVVQVDGLRRTYQTKTGFGFGRRSRHVVEAVRGVSFTVQRGELFGLLGPNGAGKTTTIKMLTTLLLPTGGEARVLGHDVRDDPRPIRERIGYVFGGDRGLYDRLSALDNLRYFAELYRVPVRDQRRRIADVLELVDLTGRERERVEGFSRGMRQRLHIARGLLHDPELLFLDEPSIGVDPVGARQLREMTATLVAAGKTIVLTTHYMYEADELCHRIAVIRRGELIAEGTSADLKARAGGGRLLEVEVLNGSPVSIARVGEIPVVHSVALEERDGGQILKVRSAAGVDVTSAVLACFDGAPIGRVSSREPTLEDAYVELVGTP
ncbi:ATP-binding cassette domain-containing protein [Streptomyces sp. NPDC056661]|uniref:ABC transporter ATP-binding protein n=1 Tax=Streptomyces sp. NPDC056661 TaxID=3345898 RepID=UPI0036C0EA5D